MRRTGRTAVAVGVAVGAMMLAPGGAGATVYCVPDLAVDGSCETAHADVQAALTAADANVGNDTVRIGVGTFTAPTSDGFTYTTANGSVAIIGSGEAQTTVDIPADTSGDFTINNVFLIDASGGGSSVSNLTVALPTPAMTDMSDQYRTIEANSLTANDVTVTAPATLPNGYGFWLNTGTSTLDEVTVDFPSPGAENAVITTSNSAVEIEDSSLTADVPVSLRGTGVTNTITRTTIVTVGTRGVDLSKGALELENSLIDLGGLSSTGVDVEDPVDGTQPVVANIEGSSIVNGGSNSTGIRTRADSDGEPLVDVGTDMTTHGESATTNLDSSLIHDDVETPLRIEADRGETATVTTTYSNYNTLPTVITSDLTAGGGIGTAVLNESDRTNFDPMFVDEMNGDYHLTQDSQLIDRGNPAAPDPGDQDIDGDAREIFGKDGCGPRRDIGSDEFVPAMAPTLLDCIPPETTIQTGPSGPIADNTPSFTFSSEAGATFQCSLNAAAPAACPASYTTPVLPDGVYTLSVQAIDASMNVDPTAATRSFTVDTTAPDTTASGPAKLKLKQQKKKKTKKKKRKTVTATYALGSTEPGSSLQCSLNGAAFAPCGASHSVALKKGTHTLSVRATDALGNVDATPASVTTRVVKKKPKRKK